MFCGKVRPLMLTQILIWPLCRLDSYPDPVCCPMLPAGYPLVLVALLTTGTRGIPVANNEYEYQPRQKTLVGM